MPKITQDQLDRNGGIYGVGDFRRMVNYTSGTNKGYVRFAATPDGKLRIEKFNNKVDVPLSWRSNTSEAHNKSIRAKFAAGIAGDLKFMGEKGEKEMVLLNAAVTDVPPDAGAARQARALRADFRTGRRRGFEGDHAVPRHSAPLGGYRVRKEQI